jgi:hypothetical protein
MQQHNTVSVAVAAMGMTALAASGPEWLNALGYASLLAAVTMSLVGFFWSADPAPQPEPPACRTFTCQKGSQIAPYRTSDGRIAPVIVEPSGRVQIMNAFIKEVDAW